MYLMIIMIILSRLGLLRPLFGFRVVFAIIGDYQGQIGDC